MLGDNAGYKRRPVVFVAGVGSGSFDRMVSVARELRLKGVVVEAPYKSASLRAQLKKADKSGAAFAIIAGEDEAARNAVMWRDMKTGVQEEIPLDKLDEKIEGLK
jgi:histidyl-tRNA synthetase